LEENIAKCLTSVKNKQDNEKKLRKKDKNKSSFSASKGLNNPTPSGRGSSKADYLNRKFSKVPGINFQ